MENPGIHILGATMIIYSTLIFLSAISTISAQDLTAIQMNSAQVSGFSTSGDRDNTEFTTNHAMQSQTSYISIDGNASDGPDIQIMQKQQSILQLQNSSGNQSGGDTLQTTTPGSNTGTPSPTGSSGQLNEALQSGGNKQTINQSNTGDTTTPQVNLAYQNGSGPQTINQSNSNQPQPQQSGTTPKQPGSTTPTTPSGSPTSGSQSPYQMNVGAQIGSGSGQPQTMNQSNTNGQPDSTSTGPGTSPTSTSSTNNGSLGSSSGLPTSPPLSPLYQFNKSLQGSGSGSGYQPTGGSQLYPTTQTPFGLPSSYPNLSPDGNQPTQINKGLKIGDYSPQTMNQSNFYPRGQLTSNSPTGSPTQLNAGMQIGGDGPQTMDQSNSSSLSGGNGSSSPPSSQPTSKSPTGSPTGLPTSSPTSSPTGSPTQLNAGVQIGGDGPQTMDQGNSSYPSGGSGSSSPPSSQSTSKSPTGSPTQLNAGVQIGGDGPQTMDQDNSSYPSGGSGSSSPPSSQSTSKSPTGSPTGSPTQLNAGVQIGSGGPQTMDQGNSSYPSGGNGSSSPPSSQPTSNSPGSPTVSSSGNGNQYNIGLQIGPGNQVMNQGNSSPQDQNRGSVSGGQNPPQTGSPSKSPSGSGLPGGSQPECGQVPDTTQLVITCALFMEMVDSYTLSQCDPPDFANGGTEQIAKQLAIDTYYASCMIVVNSNAAMEMAMSSSTDSNSGNPVGGAPSSAPAGMSFSA